MPLEPDHNDMTHGNLILTRGVRVGHYRLVSRIGAGGMGEVWRAEDELLSREVALKFLPPDMSNDEEFRHRFKREAQAAAALNHPNIITIHEIAEHEGRLFIAMELLEGKSLQELLKDDPPDFQKSLNTIVQVCLGLAKAHERGCLHRDIKPDNIFLSAEGQAKILDFGLALTTFDTRVTRAGTIMGTANYMSPEQAQGLELDHRSDIFSVGVVLYRLLAGKLPFERANLPATVHAIISDIPEPVRSHNPGLPEEFDLILARLMAKEPAQRYPSLVELINVLRPYLSGSTNLGPMTIAAPVSAQPVKSLGVLYLRNLGSPDDEFLCYGITEDLIVDLTRIGTLRVAPMRKILKYKDSDDELEEIAAKLDVGLILDGSIQKSGESIRVSATLIDPLSGKNLWAERWEESAGNLARIKQGLAQGIGAALEVGTRVIKEAEVGRPEARSSQAYEMYLRGKYSFDRKKDATDVEVALGLYRKALIEEPGLTSAGYGIAEIHIYQGEYAKAIEELRRARDEARRIQSRPDEAAILRLTARASTLLSKWDEAYRLADEARRISATIGDASGEASAIGEMIIVLERRAKFPEALTWFERVVEIGLRLDDQEAISDAYKNMGNVYFRMGQYEKARELYKQSIEIARKRGDRMTEAKCMANIGLTLTHAAKLSQALDCYETSLQIYDQLGEQAGKALVLNNIALVHSAEGKYEEAIRMYDQAAEVHEGLGNKSDFSLVLSNKARLLAIMGRYDEGIEFAERAQKIAAELDYPFVTNLAEDSIGYALQCRGDYEPAREHYQTALDVSQQAGLAREHALAHLNLGICAYYLGDYERTLVEAGEADRLAHEIGEGYIGLRAKAYLAAVAVHRGEFDSGIDRLREALKDDEQFGDPRNILDALRLLGSLLLTYARSSGERIEGKLILEQALELALKKGVVYERQRIEKLIETH